MNHTKKAMLVLTSRFPYPVIGGDKLRIYQLCKALSPHYHITLLSLCENKLEMEYPIPNDGVFERVERVLLTRWRSYLSVLFSLPTTTPLQVAYYRSGVYRSIINKLLPSHDIVLSHLIRCGDYVRNVEKPKILEMTDAISLNYNRLQKLKGFGGLKEFIYRIEARRLKTYEQKIVDDFDLSVLVSNTDRNFLFADETYNKVIICSNGVDLQRLPFSERTVESRVIAFIGNMRTVQNQDACFFFINDILPLLREKGDYRFRIIGAISDKVAKKFIRNKYVEVSGSVDSICDATRDVSIGVCPVRICAGIQNKILEYMALGLPTITTTLGHEGIQACPDKELLIADTPAEFVKKIEWISNHQYAAFEMARKARDFVEQAHNWSKILEPLVDKVSELV